MRNFRSWLKERAATYKMEESIISDKLKRGASGVEWLVFQLNVTKAKMDSMKEWSGFINHKNLEIETILVDALTITNPDLFYEKYEINWWISVKDSLVFLSVMRDRNYDRYFEIVQRIDRQHKRLQGVDNNGTTRISEPDRSYQK